VLALYQVKQILAELQQQGFPAERVRLILNRSVDYEDKVVAQEGQKMLGITAYFTLPNDHLGLAEAYACGNLLSPHSFLGREISAFASKISGIDHRSGRQEHVTPWYRKLRKG